MQHNCSILARICFLNEAMPRFHPTGDIVSEYPCAISKALQVNCEHLIVSLRTLGGTQSTRTDGFILAVLIDALGVCIEVRPAWPEATRFLNAAASGYTVEIISPHGAVAARCASGQNCLHGRRTCSLRHSCTHRTCRALLAQRVATCGKHIDQLSARGRRKRLDGHCRQTDRTSGQEGRREGGGRTV